MKFLELFPTPVSIFEIDRTFSQSEIDFIDSRLSDTYANRGNRTSNDTFVLRNPKMKDINKFCLDSVLEYSQNVYKHANCDLFITQSWLNLSKQGDFHHVHNHPNSMISGVLYIETGEDDIIQFHRNREISSFLYETTEYNQYNSLTWYVPVKIGELFLFPSHLYHEVPRVNSGKRVSLSFNTFVFQPFGSIELLSHIG